jgi:hypothetical protein
MAYILPSKKGEIHVGIIRNHLHQMKVEQPNTYKRLMEGYTSEDEFVKDVLGLSVRAINDYYLQNRRKREYGNK